VWILALALGLAWGGSAPGTIVTDGPPITSGVPTSGLEGRIIIRPVRSVARRGEANHAPYQARISVLDAKGKEVAVAESDADGNFQLDLPPGSYVLRPQSQGRYPRAAEQKVVVHAGKRTRVEIVYDSGMR
jgi:Carboxypeptidase regulatory-like domain